MHDITRGFRHNSTKSLDQAIHCRRSAVLPLPLSLRRYAATHGYYLRHTSLDFAGRQMFSDITRNHSLSYFLRLLSSDLRFHHPLLHHSLFDLSWYSYIQVPYSLYVSLSLNINYVVLLISAIRPNLLR